MPKTTFINLDDQKRATIEQAATREFAAYGFYGARLNRIVESAGIAKGSFYQYFEDLGDLYLHLLEQLADQKLAVIHDILAQQVEADFFTQYRLIFVASVRLLHGLSDDSRSLANHVPPFRDLDADRLIEMRKRGEDSVITPMITRAIARGEITADSDFAFAVVTNTNRMILQYLKSKVDSEKYSEIFKEGPDLDNAIDRFIIFLRAGLTAGHDQSES